MENTETHPFPREGQVASTSHPHQLHGVETIPANAAQTSGSFLLGAPMCRVSPLFQKQQAKNSWSQSSPSWLPCRVEILCWEG